MKIRFLGTGSAKTSLHRFHSSFLISITNHNLLVDCGDGVSSAILQQNISFASIDSIIISHLHADHYSGLASLITQMKLNQRTKRLSIFIHKSLKDFIEDYLLHSYLFMDRLGFELDIMPIEAEEEIRINESFTFISKLNSHLGKYLPKYKTDKLSFASLSFLFKEQNHSVFYSGDIGSTDDLKLFNDKIDWLITETSHIKLSELAAFLEKNNFNKVILTHIDDETEKLLEPSFKSLQKDKKQSIITASDGLILQHNS